MKTKTFLPLTALSYTDLMKVDYRFVFFSGEVIEKAVTKKISLDTNTEKELIEKSEDAVKTAKKAKEAFVKKTKEEYKAQRENVKSDEYRESKLREYYKNNGGTPEQQYKSLLENPPNKDCVDKLTDIARRSKNVAKVFKEEVQKQAEKAVAELINQELETLNTKEKAQLTTSEKAKELDTAITSAEADLTKTKDELTNKQEYLKELRKTAEKALKEDVNSRSFIDAAKKLKEAEKTMKHLQDACELSEQKLQTAKKAKEAFVKKTKEEYEEKRDIVKSDKYRELKLREYYKNNGGTPEQQYKSLLENPPNKDCVDKLTDIARRSKNVAKVFKEEVQKQAEKAVAELINQELETLNTKENDQLTTSEKAKELDTAITSAEETLGKLKKAKEDAEGEKNKLKEETKKEAKELYDHVKSSISKNTIEAKMDELHQLPSSKFPNLNVVNMDTMARTLTCEYKEYNMRYNLGGKYFPEDMVILSKGEDKRNYMFRKPLITSGEHSFANQEVSQKNISERFDLVIKTSSAIDEYLSKDKTVTLEPPPRHFFIVDKDNNVMVHVVSTTDKSKYFHYTFDTTGNVIKKENGSLGSE